MMASGFRGLLSRKVGRARSAAVTKNRKVFFTPGPLTLPTILVRTPTQVNVTGLVREVHAAEEGWKQRLGRRLAYSAEIRLLRV